MVLAVSPGNGRRRHRSSAGQSKNERPHDVSPKPAKLICSRQVVGFGHQFIRALIPPPPEGPESEAAQPGPRIMHPAAAEPFQALRTRMETEWTPQMMGVLAIDAASLPIIWDADFLYGPRTASGEDTYVLCEINVSSVFAIPDQVPAEIAHVAMQRLRGSM